MRKTLAFLLIFSFLRTTAQKESHKWYFGVNAAIDFTNCNPKIITNGLLNSQEGCATISDKTTGDLLFYTNGVEVRDSTDNIMPNGNGLSGHPSNTQVLIIPKPGSSTIFYIFTTDLQGIAGQGLRYSIIDMTLNGGLGDVSTKNVLLHSPTVCEKITATMHSNGNDIWVSTHEFGTNNFFTFLVTSGSVSVTPIISSIGYIHNGTYDSRGEMRFSPDGSKLSVTTNGDNSGNGINQVFDFDNNTGIISNCITLPSEKWGYGTCFSFDNSKLYFTTNPVIITSSTYSKLYQYDLSSSDSVLIVNSKLFIDSLNVISEGAYASCCLGMNGKIYVARDGELYIGEINNPDNSGSSCNFNRSGLFLGGNQCRSGTNNLICVSDTCSITGVLTSVPVEFDEIIPFPNPSSNYIIIELKDFVSNLTLTIFDSAGKLVWQETNIEERNIQISATNFFPGLYFFVLVDRSDKIYRTGKFIIQSY